MSPFNLINFSPEILMQILKLLDSTDLYHLSLVSEYLQNLVSDEYLWIQCDARRPPNKHEKIEFCKANINNLTKQILLAGEARSDRIIDDNFFIQIKDMPCLTVLALENQYIIGKELPLRKFPRQLEELSLARTFVTDFREFFKCCSDQLVNLRVLKLDQCRWFESYSLMAISKLPVLQILSLYLCKQLSDSAMSYISLAGRFGFRSLHVLDVRFTNLGDEILKSFDRNLCLSELYFHGYEKSFQLDCAKREVELLENNTLKENINYRNVLFEVDDTDINAMKDYFGSSFHTMSYDMQRISNQGFRGYRLLMSKRYRYIPPESVLYKRPYGPCTCGFEKNNPPENIINFNSDEVTRLKNKIIKLEKRKITPSVYLLHLDSAHEETEQTAWIDKRDPTTEMEIFTYEHMNFPLSRSSSPSVIIEIDLRLNEPNAAAFIMEDDEDSDDDHEVRHDNEDSDFDEDDDEDIENGFFDNIERVRHQQLPRQQNEDELNSTSSNLLKRKLDSPESPIQPKRARGFQQEQPYMFCTYCREKVVLDAPLKPLRPTVCQNCIQRHANGAVNRKLTMLKVISLRGYEKVDDVALRSITHLDLDLIDLTYTNVTKSGLEFFATTNPNCRIVHETACRCLPNLHF